MREDGVRGGERGGEEAEWRTRGDSHCLKAEKYDCGMFAHTDRDVMRSQRGDVVRSRSE